MPIANRIALLVNPTDAENYQSTLRELEAASGRQQILVREVATGREIDEALASIAREKADALFVAPGSFFNTRGVQLAVLAARHALPASYAARAYAEAGGLMSYGTDILDAFRQVGVYTGRVLKGAKPRDLPVLQSTKFELVVNLNTAPQYGASARPCNSGVTARARRRGDRVNCPPAFRTLAHQAAASRSAEAASRRSRHRTRPWSIRASGTAKVGTMTSG